MTGTNPVGVYAETQWTGAGAQTPNAWLGQSDANSAVLMRPGNNFAPQPAGTPAMSVVVAAGWVSSLLPNGQQVVNEVAPQTVTIGAAPGSPNNRIDMVVVDAATGVASVVAGTPATTAVAPAQPAGKLKVALVSVPNGTSAISNSLITDVRTVWQGGAPGVPWSVATGTGDAISAAYTPANGSLVDGLLLAVRVPGANATTAPTFSPDGLTAHTITRTGGVALRAGDLPGNLAEVLLRFNLPYSRWELLNPQASSGGVAGVTSATTLTAAQIGDFVEIGGASAFTTTVPSPVGVFGGFKIFNTCAFTQTIATAAGAFFGPFGNGTASITIPAGGAIEIQSDTSNWCVIFSSANSAPTSAQITSALGFTPANNTTIGSMKGVTATATNLSLTTAQAGSVIKYTGTGSVTLTLPDPSTCYAAVFRFLFTAGVQPTIATLGAAAVYWWQTSAFPGWATGAVAAPGMFDATSDGSDWYIR